MTQSLKDSTRPVFRSSRRESSITCDENRLVHSLEARRYTDIQIEHPDQWHCSRRDSTYSYRARSPGGILVHGGACVFFYFFIPTSEPIWKKSSARG
jgi:hypothetical protein